MPLEMRSVEASWTSSQRRKGEDREPVIADEERVLVDAVTRAAVLYDAQAPRRDLILDAKVEEDHAVGHVLLEAVACERFIAALGGYDRRHPFVLQPSKEPAQLGAQNVFVGESREEHLDRVEQNALGADGVDRVSEPDEKAVQVVIARFLELGRFEHHLVHDQLLLRDEAIVGRIRMMPRWPPTRRRSPRM